MTVTLLALDVQAQSVSARLDLGSTSTITPIPVTFRITFVNETAEPKVVPRQAVLIVTPLDGVPFLARWRGSLVADLASAGFEQVLIQPRGSASLEMLNNLFFDSPAWFTDSRLYAVGRKRLRIVFGNDLDTVVTDDPATPRLLVESTHTIASSVAVLDVKPNKSDDAAACTLVREKLQSSEPCPMHAVGAQQKLIREVLETYPESAYYQFLVARVPDGDVPSRIARIEAALSGQSEPTLSWNLLALADLSDFEMGEALARKDQALAKRFAQKAEVAYRRLASSPFNYFRTAAAERSALARCPPRGR